MKHILALTALLLAPLAMLHAADLVLVAPGFAPAPIVVFKDAPPRTRDAAVTLADYIEKTGGARPQIVDGEPQPVPERAIWVGYQPALKTLFPKLDFDFKQPEEILVAANENHLVIAGRDRWDPRHLTVPSREGRPVPKQQEYGTANAVYTFLHDKLGVRWLWPGELGVDLNRRDTIRFAPFERRYHPPIRARGGVFHFSSQINTRGYGRAHEWARLQRLQLDSLEMEGGHAFSDWWERYHKTHPDIFALQPDGTRSGFPNPRTAKLCMSNPKVWELWLKDVAEQLAKDPTRTVFNASPNDGWMSGHCVCKNCSAWDHPDSEPRLFHWKKHQEERPALSDRDVTFANKLGELIKAKYPGKDYHVLMLSYGHSRPAPVKARPADNVIMSVVANFFGRTGLVDRGSTRGDTYRQQFQAWAKIVPAMLWRPNTGSPAGWQQGLPDLHVTQTIKDLKDVAAANCIGIFIDSVWEHWATQGPQYYVMAQLVWDPAQDGTAILNDYYRRGFGPAADAVRAYFEMWEQARMAYVAERGEAGVFDFPRLYTAERFRAAEAHLQRATAAVAAASERYRQRVEFVRAGLTFTQHVIENATLMRRYWLKKDEAIGAQVRKNWEAMERLCAAHPYAINWGPCRPGTPRMLGLHPDHPNPKVNRQRLKDLDLN
ncbi:MAG: DUF4838 domain-containing protein [Verrucomicrobia bacterium]|nr:DUF4838 domain-containing protein [Verrucomicrobiota bacterium]